MSTNLITPLVGQGDMDICEQKALNQEGYSKLKRAPFLFLNAHVNNYHEYAKEALEQSTSQVQTKGSELLRTAFFSPENMEIIQKQIILYVYEKSNHMFLIPRQKREWVHMAMLYIFNEYGQNLPFRIKDQIRELNAKVAKEVGPQIISQLEQYVGYIRDISQQPTPIDRPMNVSAAGNRTLPSVMTRVYGDSFWGN